MTFRSQVCSLVLALAVAASAPLATGQLGPGDVDQQYDGRKFDYPLNAQGNAYTESAAVKFTEDVELDYLALRGGFLVMWPSVETHMNPLTTPFPGNDLGVLPGVAPDGRPGVLLPNANGLHLRWWDGGQMHLSVLGGMAWRGALFADGADLNGDAYPDVIGVDYLGTGVLVLYGQAGGAFTIGTGFNLSASARQMVVLDADGDGDDEVAFRLGSSVVLYEADGTVLRTITTSHPTLAVASVYDENVALDMVAILTDEPTEQVVTLYNELGSAVGSLGLGDVEASRMRAAEYFAFASASGGVGSPSPPKGREELFLTLTSHQMIAIVDVNTTTPSIWDIVTLPGDDPFKPAAGNFVEPGLDDFDNDGDTDIVNPSNHTGLLHVMHGDRVDEDFHRPRVTSNSEDATGVEVVFFDSIDDLHDPDLVTPNVLVFVKTGGWQGNVDPTPLANVNPWPIPQSGGASGWSFHIPMTPAELLEFENGDRIYYCQVRMVETDGGTGILDAGPSLVHILTGSDALLAYYSNLPTSNGLPVQMISPDDTGGGAPDSQAFPTCCGRPVGQ